MSAGFDMDIDKGWSFTQLTTVPGVDRVTQQGEWIPVQSFPTTVHVELLKLKKIPDPFVGLHEWDVQWVGETEWAFKTTFELEEKRVTTDYVDLIFEGLDTFATVTLNGKEILSADNAFVSWRVPAKEYLKVGPNELQIAFANAMAKGRALEKEHGKLNLWNGDSSRLHVRKAQYNYGWDWGPILMTVGPWKTITVHSYSSRSGDADVRIIYNADSDSFTLDIDVEIIPPTAGYVAVTLPTVNRTVNVDIDEKGHAIGKLELKQGDVEKWYPVGYGEAKLYELHIVTRDQTGKALHGIKRKIGFRDVKIVEDKLVDQDGLTFLFEVNGIRIFCGGSNWIPADSFLTTMTKKRYRDWLQLLVDGNQNMIRVWGGGIYETDDFYDICDELGILVWQDFMFGCGQYPAYDSILKSIEVEAEQAVKRLRDHPSVVIFAGNNEDYQVAESLNLELDYNDETSDFRKTNFPARHIYERTLPSITNKHSNIHYHRSSPYSGHGKPTTDKTYGDLHQWNVWHGTQEPWHNWDILAGRFVSEFGMEGYPDIRTVDYWLGGNTAERFPQSRTMNNHNKADGFERRLELYLMENFKHAFDIDSYVYYTQIMQAETLASAYRLWRRNWKGKGREYTAGALVWQINDCWPVTSWAIVDYFLRPKPAFYTISRELRPFSVGMTRKEEKTFASDSTTAFFEIKTILQVWATNSTLAEKNVSLEVTAFELNTDWTESWKKEVTLAPNAATELYKGDLPGQPVRTKLSDVPRTIIISARIVDSDGTVLGRYSNWPEPFKFIHFPTLEQTGLKVTVASDGENVELSTKQPIKGIVLDVDGEAIRWSDQAIDLVPGDPQVVKAPGLAGRTVKYRYLGDGTA